MKKQLIILTSKDILYHGDAASLLSNLYFFPFWRLETIKSFQTALQEASSFPSKLVSPLQHFTQHQIIEFYAFAGEKAADQALRAPSFSMYKYLDPFYFRQQQGWLQMPTPLPLTTRHSFTISSLNKFRHQCRSFVTFPIEGIKAIYRLLPQEAVDPAWPETKAQNCTHTHAWGLRDPPGWEGFTCKTRTIVLWYTQNTISII